MKRLIFMVLIVGFLLVACGSAGDSGEAVQAVEKYLNALVAQNADQISALVCADWESDALIELDSFQAVTTRLDGLACQQTGTDGDTTLVHCQGKIIATYNGEDQELDLSTRTYDVVQQGSDWLVCGVR